MNKNYKIKIADHLNKKMSTVKIKKILTLPKKVIYSKAINNKKVPF